MAYLYFSAGCVGSEHLVAAVLTVTITNTQGADELVTHITENTRNFIVVVLQHIHISLKKSNKETKDIFHNPVGVINLVEAKEEF